MTFVTRTLGGSLLLLTLLASCSPQKRIARLMDKYPSAVTSSNKDTTIYFETVSKDTSFIINNTSHRDTFYIEDTKTKIYRHLDTLYVTQEGIRDSVRIQQTTHEVIVKERSTKSLDRLIILFIVILFIVGFIVFRPKR